MASVSRHGRRLALGQLLGGLLGATLLAVPPALAQEQGEFECGTAWLSQGSVDTVLYQLDLRSNPIEQRRAGSAELLYNALGFNPKDNNLYAIRKLSAGKYARLLRVHPSGAVTELDADPGQDSPEIDGVSGLAAAASYPVGAFGPDGTYYVMNGEADAIYVLGDVSAQGRADGVVAKKINLSEHVNIHDMAWVGADQPGARFYSVTVDPLSTPQLIAIDLPVEPDGTATVTAIGPIKQPWMDFGALFAASNGLFGAANGGEGLFEFDLQTGTATHISQTSGSQVNDGASCALAAFDFPTDIAVSKTNTYTPEQPDDLADDVYAPGETRTYTMVVSNHGPFGAQGIRVIDPLPAGALPGSGQWLCTDEVAGGQCLARSGNGDLDVAVNLPVDAAVTLQFTMQIDPALRGDLASTVRVETGPGSPDLNPDNNIATDLDLQFNVTQSKALLSETGDFDGVAEPGETLTYAITVSNSGTLDLVDFVARDRISVAGAALDGVIALVSSPSPGFNNDFDPGTGQSSWTIPLLASGETVTLELAVTLRPRLPAGLASVTNAVVEDCTIVTVETGAPCAVTTPVVPPVITTSKRLQGESGALPGLAEAGETLTYAITVANTGGVDVRDYRVTDQLSLTETVGLSDVVLAVASSSPGFNNDFDPSTGQSSWTIPLLAAGETVTLELAVTLRPRLPAGLASVTNAVVEDCTIVTVETGAPCAVTTPVVPPTISTSKRLEGESGALPGLAEAGETLTYAITVANTGGVDMREYRVIDQLSVTGAGALSDAIQAVGSPSPGFNDDFDPATGQSSWTIPLLAAGETVTLELAVTLRPTLPAGLASVTNAVVEDCTIVTVETGAPCAVTTPVVPPVITTSKRLQGESGAQPGLAEAGETLTYAITVANTGGVDVRDYRVTDQLSVTGAGALSDAIQAVGSPSPGFNNDFDPSTGQSSWTIPLLAAGETVTLELAVTLRPRLPAGLASVTNAVVEDCTIVTVETGAPCAVTTPVVPPVITTSKRLQGESGAQPGVAEAGETLTYAITVANTGGVDVRDYRVTDQLSVTGAGALSDAIQAVGSPSPGFNNDFDPSTGQSSWTIPLLAAGETVTLELAVTLRPRLPAGLASVTNAVVEDCTIVTVGTGAPCAVTTPVVPPVITTSKRLQGESGAQPGVAEAGETLTYAITVANTGGVDMRDYRVIDQLSVTGAGALSDAIQAVGSPSPGFNDDFDPATGISSWTIPLLPAGSTQTLVFTVTLPSDLPDGLLAIDNATRDDCTVLDDLTGVPCRVTTPVDTPGPATVSMVKQAMQKQARRGEVVPYRITLTNWDSRAPATVVVRDRVPAGFRYLPQSARVDGVPQEPVIEGDQLSFADVVLAPGSSLEIDLALQVLASTPAGAHTNHANAYYPDGQPVGPDATADVVVLPEAVFDCADIVGRVFDDQDRNGFAGPGEPGLAGVRLATVSGELLSTDQYGRFHIPCADLPTAGTGANFILKLDPRTLPTGYVLTTENPRVVRLTPGKMVELDFGVALRRVMRLELTDAAFEPGQTALRGQWMSQLGLLVDLLQSAPTTLQISLVASAEAQDLAARRLAAIERGVRKMLIDVNTDVPVEIETQLMKLQ